MEYNKKLICYYFLFFCAILMVAAAVNAETGIYVECDRDYIAADIKEAPLKDVLSRLQEQSGIWFRGDDALLNHNVTIKFDKITMIEGLKRILLSINHAMIFDKTGTLRGIVLVGAGEGGNLVPSPVAANAKREPSVLGGISIEHDDSPSAFREHFLMQDITVRSDQPFPSDDPPSMEKVAREGPGAGEPPERGPDTGQNQKHPVRYPGAEPPKFATPPMPENPSTHR